MIKKFLLGMTFACFTFGIAHATTYGSERFNSEYNQTKIYDCNWADHGHIRYYIHQLERYGIQTVVYPYQLRIVIPNSVFFIPLTNVVVYTAQDPFYILAALLETLPGVKIKIIGYSDNVALQQVNLKESLDHAQKLSAYLWMNNIPNETQDLKYQGDGENSPIANNISVDGMAKNRRVEVWVTIPHAKGPMLG